MGWTQDQWNQAQKEYNGNFLQDIRLPSMYRVMAGHDQQGMSKYLKLMEWWQCKFTAAPPNRPVVKPTESKSMSTERVNFGFPCKILSKGWREDFHKGAMVFEIRVAVGSANFGAARALPMHEIQFGRYDTEPMQRAIERDVVENLKREVFDKLFPNL